jgi:PhnB protein
MADQESLDRLNLALEALFAERLRDLPSRQFKMSLKEELMQTATIQETYSPTGFRTLTPYLIGNGTSKLIEFLKQSFGAEEVMRVPTPDGKIMHAQMRIGDSQIEMSDGSEQYPGNPVALHLYVEDADAVYTRALAAGGTSLFAPADREYGDREASVKDPCGNYWYIATHKLRPGSHRPEGLYAITPYLHPKGTRGLIDFLVKAFDARELFSHPNPDGSIAHAKVSIGDSMIEMGEAHDQWQPMPASIHFYVPNADEVYARALAAGGTSVQPLGDQPYGERSGGVQDPWGNRWWIATYTGSPR